MQVAELTTDANRGRTMPGTEIFTDPEATEP